LRFEIYTRPLFMGGFLFFMYLANE